MRNIFFYRQNYFRNEKPVISIPFNFCSVLQPVSDTIAFIFARMTDIDHPVTVPAGTFETNNYQHTYKMWPKFRDGGETRHLNNRYALDVGLVEEYQGFYIADKSSDYFVRRLVRYGQQ